MRILLLIAALFVMPAHAGLRALSELPLVSLPDVDGKRQWSLPAGVYAGNFVVAEPLQLRCEAGAILDGEKQGNVLLIQAADVVIDGCTLRDWGADLTAMNAGVFLEKTAQGAVIRNSTLTGPSFGIWVDTTADVRIENNRITGDASVRSQDRGNGIHLFKVSGARVVGNQVRDTRDGIYIDVSNNNVLEANVLEDLRYGIHYMYSNNNRVIGNVTRHTRTGYALMQSHHLTVIGNRSEDDQNYGILMNYITYSELRDNVIGHVRSGGTDGDAMISGAEGKAVFIYNSVGNRLENNQFTHSALGIHLTAGSEENVIQGNAFIANQQQVKYVATRTQEWSKDGRGNYWSDYLGWDRNDDGIGDIAYEPNDAVDRLMWKYPQARLLMNSPAIELLRWVQRAFPVVRSAGVKDSYPLMQPVAVKVVSSANTGEPSR